MGRFDGIETTKVTKTGSYFKPGMYKVRIKAVKWVKASVGTKEFCIIETDVLESSNPEVPAGSERSHVIDMSTVMGMPTIKSFVACVSGVDPSSESINDEVVDYWAKATGSYSPFAKICDLICSDANPLEGEEMELECVEITTREGKPFTKHNWAVREVG